MKSKDATTIRLRLDMSRATAPIGVIVKRLLKILLRTYRVRSLGVWQDE